MTAFHWLALKNVCSGSRSDGATGGGVSLAGPATGAAFGAGGHSRCRPKPAAAIPSIANTTTNHGLRQRGVLAAIKAASCGARIS